VFAKAGPQCVGGSRSDAQRNHARLLVAARKLFGTDGFDVGVDEIARAAGVGKGTLYRHFPTKEALVAAVVQDTAGTVAHAATCAAEIEDPARGFVSFLAWTTLLQAHDTGFYEALAITPSAEVVPPELIEQVLAVVAVPLRRAQQAGVIRADLQPEDVRLLLRMLGAAVRDHPPGCAAPGSPGMSLPGLPEMSQPGPPEMSQPGPPEMSLPESVLRPLRLLLDGLAAPGASLPEPAPIPGCPGPRP